MSWRTTATVGDLVTRPGRVPRTISSVRPPRTARSPPPPVEVIFGGADTRPSGSGRRTDGRRPGCRAGGDLLPAVRVAVRSAGCILYRGYNPSVARLVHATATTAALRRGARLVVVDPRRAGLASKAEHWLRVRPGTDGAL